MKRFNAFFLGVMAACTAMAQTSYEAAELIGTDLVGSARYVGMGGAMSAFGNDLSVISKNPAGIGMYSTNDVMTTMSFSTAKTFTDDSYGRDNKTGSPLKLGIDNLAYVCVYPLEHGGSLNIAFAYHKIKDQKYSINYNDEMKDNLSYLIYRDFEKNVSNRVNQYDFNVSMNVNDNVFWGVTLGVQSAQYRSDGYFYDYYPVQTGYSKSYDNYAYDGYLDYDASGCNMTFGVVMKSTSGHSRLGLSVQTPTITHVDEKYLDYMYANAGVQKSGEEFSQTTSYNVYSPWVFNLGIGVSGKHSALGFEYELADASRASLHSGRTKLRTQGSDDLMAYSTYRV